MKRFYIVICLLLMNVLIYSLSQAYSAQSQTIRIAAFNFYPTLFQAKDGSVQGFYVDFLKEIAKRENWNIEYVYGNWSDGLARIKSGEVDLLTNVAFTNERAEFMDYGKVPLLTVWAELYVNGGSSIDSIKEVKGKKIALMKGDFNAANFKSLVEKLEIPCTYVELGDFEEVFKAISEDKVDAGVVNNTFGAAKQREYGVQSSGIVFNPFDIYFTAAKGKNSQVLATLDKYLAEWRKSEGSPYHQARERWSHKSVSIMKVTPASIRRIVIFFVLISCGAIAFVVVLRIQVRRKTAALKHEIEIRTETEERLRENKLRLDAILDNVGAYIFIKDTEYRYTFANRKACELFGHNEDDIIGKNDSSFFSADSVEKIMQSDRPVIERGDTVRREETDLTVEDKLPRTYWTVKIPLRDSNDKIYGLCGISTDITEHKNNEANILESRQRLQMVLDSLESLVYVADFETHEILFLNKYGREIFGDILGKTCWQALQDGQAGPCPFCTNDRLVSGDGPAGQIVWEFKNTLNGRWYECRDQAISWSDGKLVRMEIATDITERKRLEEDLHHQTTLLEEELAERQITQEALQDQTAILEEEIEERRRAEEALQQSETTVRNKLKAILEPEGDIGTLELSDVIDTEMLQSLMESFYQLTGILGAVLDISGNVLVAVGWQDICTKFHRCNPDTNRNCIESDTILTNGVPVGTFKQYRCKNNMWDMVTPLEVGGRHVGNVFIGQFFYEDETPDVELFRKQARCYGFDEAEYLAALERVPRFSREMADAGIKFYSKVTKMISDLSFSSIKVSRMLAERIHLEEQLRQSQKMEAVGQLAGGVAHDFNNILQVISGYGYMLKMDDTLNDKQKEEIDHILSASEKAAQLTRGLLAFSRKQVMTLGPVNLNDIIENVKKFLVRIIGEDIQLKTITYENRLKIYADTGQIEQVLINLATNARDAMQKGGLLTIESGFQVFETPVDHESGQPEPGRYAVMTVSDTGFGMDDETCKRIFEPFYTTKEVGKGTGLGMSIVYGIVKQHNGFINVYSEPGHGTTFRIYIPIYETEQSEQEGKTLQVAPPQGGSESILLAEDEATVRKLVSTVLTKFGYSVIQAVDGQDAVEKFAESRESISMILMDMIMPKKNGKEAYEEISRIQPGIKVLYSSGYTADFIQNRGVDEAGIELIMKPVQPMELLRKVREMLDSK